MTKKLSVKFWFLGLFFSAGAVFGQTPADYELGKVIVSASKFNEYVSETGSSVIVITKETFEKKKYKTVLDAVRNESGISTSSNSAFGGATSVFLRGADSGHTLVTLDGVRLYDPISTNATYDLSNLTLDNVERIEIIKGAQSSLYGSDAIGGVINIITSKGHKSPSLIISSEWASENTWTEKLSASGMVDRFHYSFGFSRQDSEGISKARDGKEKDAYQRTSINSKIGFSPNEDIDIGLSALYLRARYDNDDGAFEDDPNNWMKYENALIAFYVNNRIGNFLSQSLKYSWLRNVRQSFDDPDTTDTTEYYRAWFKGWLQEAELSHTLDTSGYFNFSDNITDTTLAGLQYNHEAGKDFSVYGQTPRITSDNLGFFIENKIGLNEKLFNSIAFRLDNHSRFGSHLTGRTTLSYLLAKETRVKGSYGSGFNAPSLYQLFSDYGNPNLNPEKSWGYDLGFEQDFFSKQAQLGLTFFHNRYKDLITFDSLAPNPKIPYWPYGLYANKGSAKTEGVEVSLNYKISDNLRFGYDFTYTKALDLTDNIHLLRRPNNKHRLAVNYSPWNLLTIDFEIIRNVKIYDSFSYGAAPSRLKDYTVANLSLSYNLKENIEIYTKIENIFDELYQEVNGYSVKPRFYHFGITARF